MEYIHHYDGRLGRMTLASDGQLLTGLWFDGQKHFASTLSADHEEQFLPIFEQTCRWLDIYFSGNNPSFMPPLRIIATPFAKRVCQIMLDIPFGSTTTYAVIARKIAEERGLKSMSAQAVGGAVGRNPISVIIPCHRVVGSNGALTGYASGLDRKQWMLEMERNVANSFGDQPLKRR